MKKNNKNKVLLISLIVLVAAFVATRLFRAPALESNLDTDLFAIDTALIRSVSFTRPGKPALTLEKNGNAWTVSEDSKRAGAETNAIDNFLRALSEIKPERIVSRSDEKWTTYQVDDSASIHMKAFDQDNEPIVDWFVGKQSQRVTYVRPADEDEVYAMEGSLRNQMDDDFNEWRDKTFVRIKPATIRKITFTYPADSGFVLEKNGVQWMIDNQKADSTNVERYLMKLQSRALSEFAEDFEPSGNPDVTLSIEKDNGDPTVIKAWREGDEWSLNSTFQPDVYFRDSRIDDDLFTGKKAFLSAAE